MPFWDFSIIITRTGLFYSKSRRQTTPSCRIFYSAGRRGRSWRFLHPPAIYLVRLHCEQHVLARSLTQIMWLREAAKKRVGAWTLIVTKVCHVAAVLPMSAAHFWIAHSRGLPVQVTCVVLHFWSSRVHFTNYTRSPFVLFTLSRSYRNCNDRVCCEAWRFWINNSTCKQKDW
jgi:hypothetical protein